MKLQAAEHQCIQFSKRVLELLITRVLSQAPNAAAAAAAQDQISRAS